MKRFLRWLFNMEPRVWLVRDDWGFWHKAVTYDKPSVFVSWHLMGPFRSEVDAEETADRMNKAKLGRVKLYTPETCRESEPEDG